MSQAQPNGSENYRIVFLGVTEGSDANIQAFSEKLSKQFQIPLEKALRITRNPPVVVKKSVSRTKAERYRQVFVKLGGQVRIEQIDSGTQSHPAATATGRVEGLETTAIETQSQVGEGPDPSVKGQNPERDEAIAKAYDDAIAGAYEEGFTPPAQDQSNAPRVQGFQCPACGQEQQKGTECLRCGVIFEKHERLAETVRDRRLNPDEASSEAEPIPQDMEVKIEPAGFWIRLGAYIVDNVLITLLSIVLGVVFMLLFGVGRNPMALASLGPLFYLISLFLPFAYFIYYLGKRGYTPGKGFLGLQVIRQDGTGISYGDATIRTFSYILSSLPFNLGFLWIAFDRAKQGWHDKIAKTQVIRAEEVSAWRRWVVFIPVILIPILGIVAAIGMPIYLKYSSRVDVAKAVSEMQTVKSHLEGHYYRYERYPRTGEFRAFLMKNLGRVPQDPFNSGRPYRYESDGSTFMLWSIGPDREDNSAVIAYDPLVTPGFWQKGDIILYSDAETEDSGEMFEITPEGTVPSIELFGATPSPR